MLYAAKQCVFLFLIMWPLSTRMEEHYPVSSRIVFMTTSWQWLLGVGSNHTPVLWNEMNSADLFVQASYTLIIVCGGFAPHEFIGALFSAGTERKRLLRLAMLLFLAEPCENRTCVWPQKSTLTSVLFSLTLSQERRSCLLCSSQGLRRLTIADHGYKPWLLYSIGCICISSYLTLLVNHSSVVINIVMLSSIVIFCYIH